MHTRRLASLLLGFWLGGSLLVMVVATHNFAAVDRLLASQTPGAAKVVRDLGPDTARAFLRFQAAESNGWLFDAWEWTELGLGIALLAIFRLRRSSSRVESALAGAMLAAVVVMHLFLAPEILRLGSALAFVPPSGLSTTREQFRQYHMAYGILAIVEIGLGMTLTAVLLRRHEGGGARTRKREASADPAC